MQRRVQESGENDAQEEVCRSRCPRGGDYAGQRRSVSLRLHPSRFLYRVTRQGAAVTAAALVGVSVVASSMITARSTATIDATLQENWRGAYDLLVTADGGLSATADATGGVIEQNFTAFTGTDGISLADLDRVRAVPGVEVAAPLSFIGQLSSPAYGVLVGATDTSGSEGTGFFGSVPRAFDVDVELRADDGVREQVLSSAATTIVTARGSTGPLAVTTEPLAVSTGTSGDGRWFADVTLPGLPELSSGVVAVDPDAEQRLLGPGAVFLEPLAQFDQLQREGAGAKQFARLVDPGYEYEHTTLSNGKLPGPLMPVVVSDSAYTTVTAHLTITPVDTSGMDTAALLDVIDDVRVSLTEDGRATLQASPRGDQHQDTVDLTDRLVPFALPYLSIALPGADEPPGGTALESTPVLEPELVTRSSYTQPQPGRPSAPVGGTVVEVEPQGFVSVTPTAQEQTYRLQGATVTGTGTAPFYAPVGTYSPGDVTGTADQASYVPLGTYSPGTAQVMDGDHRGATLRPTFSGRGVVLAAPGAITTLSAMGQVRPDVQVDVVRVRVDGVQDYSAASVERIESVATAISDLGLQVRVVAGSSLEPVAVYVPQYFDQSTDLGWTVQEWTSLGAAVRVEAATLGASAWLLVISLIGVTALAAASQASSVATRQREAALLTSLGWSRSRVRAWFLAEGAVGVVLVVAAAAVALVISGTFLTRVVAAAAVLLYAALVVGGAWWATRPSTAARATGTTRPAAARTAGAIGARNAAARPLLTGLTGTALVVMALTTTSFAAAAVTARQAAGSTRLAALLTSRLLLPQLTLALTATVATVVLFVIGTRAFASATVAQRLMLAASGWSGRDIARTARATVVRAAAPAALLSAGLSLALGIVLARDHLVATISPAVSVLISALAAAMVHATIASQRVVRVRETRREVTP